MAPMCTRKSSCTIYEVSSHHFTTDMSPILMSHAGTERVEHIQIIITSAQEADNVIPTLGPVYTILGRSN